MALDAYYRNESGSRLPAQHADAMDDLLQSVPVPDIFDGAEQYGVKRPVAGLEQILDQVVDAVHNIGTNLGVIAFNGGIVRAVAEKYPDRIGQLPPQYLAIVQDLVTRVADITPAE